MQQEVWRSYWRKSVAIKNARMTYTPRIFHSIFNHQIYQRNIILPMTSNAIDGKSLMFSEFMRYLGLWLIMSTQVKTNVREYFSSSKIDPCNSGALFKLNEVMAYNRFYEITRSLTYIDIEAPNYRYKFYEIRQFLASFNKKMKSIFLAGWVSCLDEIMSIWTRRWTCPGWMYVPRKPNPKGNEYHYIWCSVSGIMYGIEIVEGKDRPIQRGN